MRPRDSCLAAHAFLCSLVFEAAQGTSLGSSWFRGASNRRLAKSLCLASGLWTTLGECLLTHHISHARSMKLLVNCSRILESLPANVFGDDRALMCICACMCLCAHVCVCVCACLCVCVRLSVCVLASLCACMCAGVGVVAGMGVWHWDWCWRGCGWGCVAVRLCVGVGVN